MQMSDQHSSRVEMNFRQLVQRILDGVQLCFSVRHFYTSTASAKYDDTRSARLTSTADEILVQLVREERIGKGAEEVLHARRDCGEIVELVEILQIEILSSFETLRNELRLTVSSRLSIDSFVVHSCNIQSVYARATNNEE